MKKLIYKFIKIFTQRLITQVIIVFIICAIFCVSCIQIYDRCKFHTHIKNAATEYVDSITQRQIAVLQDSSFYAKDSIEKPIIVTFNKDERISLYNNNFNNSPKPEHFLHVREILDILSKSDGILSANGITFLVTLIVALLVTLLIYKMDAEQRARENYENKIEKWREKFEDRIEGKIENKIEEKIEELQNGTIAKLSLKINTVIIHSVRFDRILTSVASIYSLGIMIGNSTMGLSSAKSKKTENVSKKIGGLCSRLSLTCDDLKTRLNDDKKKIEFLTKEEKEILDTYLTDTLGELERSQNYAERMKIEALSNIIANKIDIVEEIKDTLNRVEIQEDMV